MICHKHSTSCPISLQIDFLIFFGRNRVEPNRFWSSVVRKQMPQLRIRTLLNSSLPYTVHRNDDDGRIKNGKCWIFCGDWWSWTIELPMNADIWNDSVCWERIICSENKWLRSHNLNCFNALSARSSVPNVIRCLTLTDNAVVCASYLKYSQSVHRIFLRKCRPTISETECYTYIFFLAAFDFTHRETIWEEVHIVK